MPKTKSAPRPPREGATWVNLGTDGHIQMRLSRAIEQSEAKPLRQEAEQLYNAIYPPSVPRVSFGVFLSHLIDVGLQQVRQQVANPESNESDSARA